MALNLVLEKKKEEETVYIFQYANLWNNYANNVLFFYLKRLLKAATPRI